MKYVLLTSAWFMTGTILISLGWDRGEEPDAGRSLSVMPCGLANRSKNRHNY